MKVLVVGKGAREHALCWRLAQSPQSRIFCAGGNPGINRIATPVGIDPGDIGGLVTFALDEKIDLTVVGGEEPLALGIVDQFQRHGLVIFGPTQSAAQLETSKAFAKQLMREAGIPTADFAVFDNADTARSHVRTQRGALVVKADGLALGKGVIVCPNKEAALEAVTDAMERRKFGDAGSRIIIEECLHGEELSFFAITDGERALPLGFVQDHKQIYDGDRGPNTGGMGAYAPVPHLDGRLQERVMREVVTPTLAAMRQRGTPFRGVLYVGLMLSEQRLNVLEFNVRFGDPECEPLMMLLRGDLAHALADAACGRLGSTNLELADGYAASVVLASGGYPGAYRRGLPILGLAQIEASENSLSDHADDAYHRTPVLKVFHAGTTLRDGNLVTDGGRVMAVTAAADSLREALSAAYAAADMIEFEGKQLRRDIGRKALARLET